MADDWKGWRRPSLRAGPASSDEADEGDGERENGRGWAASGGVGERDRDRDRRIATGRGGADGERL